jgi:hypothetical protein
MKKLTPLPLLLLVVVACDVSEQVEMTTVTVTDSAGIKVIVNPPPEVAASTMWSAAETPEFAIGVVDGAGADVLQHVTGGAILSNGGVALADGSTNELRFYDSKGRHLTSVGGEGVGPDEFRALHLAGGFGGDSLLAVDQRTRRGVVYDEQGNSARYFVFRDDFGFPRPVGVLDNGAMVADPQSSTNSFAPPGPTWEVYRPEWEVEVADSTGALAALIGRFPGGEFFRSDDGGSGSVLFGRRLHVSAARDRVAVANDDAFRIRVYDPAGNLLHIIAQQRSPVEISASDFDAAIDDAVGQHKIPAFQRAMRAALEQGPRPTTFPAMAALHVDRDRRIWVREFARPRDDHTTWQVFGSEGELEGSITLPGEFELLDADQSRLLVLGRGPNGVETVQLFAARTTTR